MKKKKNRLKALRIGLLVVFVSLVGAAVGYLLHDHVKSSSKEERQEEADRLEAMVIHTEYGDLYYPQQWSEYLKTEQNRDRDSLQVSFAARLGDKDFPMFQVTIGDSEDTRVGELTDQDGTRRTVHMKVTELEGMEELSETERQRIYAMQEDLNYIIDHLK